MQAPYIDDETMKQELEVIKDEFQNKERQNFQELLEVKAVTKMTEIKESGDQKEPS